LCNSLTSLSADSADGTAVLMSMTRSFEQG
jgi:hypothetical protein